MLFPKGGEQMKRTIEIGRNICGTVWLAPMAGMTDRTFRQICRAHGAEYVTTEMVSAKAVCYHDRKTNALAAITPEEGPTAVQIFGSEPETMARAASLLLEFYAKSGVTPAAIDAVFSGLWDLAERLGGANG